MTEFNLEEFNPDIEHHNRCVSEVVELSHQSFMIPLDEDALEKHQFSHIALATEDDGESMNFAGYAAITHEYSENVVELGSLMVADRYRRAGLATKLIEAVHGPAKQRWPGAQILAFSNADSRGLFEKMGGRSIPNPNVLPDEVWKVCEDCNSYQEAVVNCGMICCGRVYDISEIAVGIQSSTEETPTLELTPEDLDEDLKEFLYGIDGVYEQIDRLIPADVTDGFTEIGVDETGRSVAIKITRKINDGVSVAKSRIAETTGLIDVDIEDAGRKIALRVVKKQDGGISITKSSTIDSIDSRKWHYRVLFPSPENYNHSSLISTFAKNDTSANSLISESLSGAQDFEGTLQELYYKYKSHVAVAVSDLRYMLESS